VGFIKSISRNADALMTEAGHEPGRIGSRRVSGTLTYALLRAVMEAVAVARKDRRTLEAAVQVLRRAVTGSAATDPGSTPDSHRRSHASPHLDPALTRASGCGDIARKANHRRDHRSSPQL
jgi:hypothetical protein